MIPKQNCRVGMRILFGREGDEKVLGEITKLNIVNAKVKCLEDKGHKFYTGKVWHVPYDMLHPINSVTKFKFESVQIIYDPSAKIENLILEAIMLCYSLLAVTGDNDTMTRLNALQLAYGAKVTEEAVFTWNEKRLSKNHD